MIHALRDSVRLTGGLHSIRLQLDAGEKLTNHHHSLPTVVLIVRGCMTVSVDGEQTHIPDNTVQLVSRDVVRTIVAGHDGAECIVVTAAIDQPVGAHRYWNGRQMRIISAQDAPVLWPQLAIAAADADATSDKLERVLLNLLQVASGQDGGKPAARWHATALAALDAAPGHTGTIRALARALDLHPVHLGRVVRSREGLTIREYVRRSKVRRAALLLRVTTATVSQVAHRAGFADQAHLCREFGRRVGMSPSQFRARLREAANANVALVQAQAFPGAHFEPVQQPRIRETSAPAL